MFKSSDLLYSRVYEFDPNFEVERIAKRLFHRSQYEGLDPIIYQAVSFGEVFIQSGGVYDYESRDLANPLLVFQPVREMIYSFLFPKSLVNNIKIKEYRKIPVNSAYIKLILTI